MLSLLRKNNKMIILWRDIYKDVYVSSCKVLGATRVPKQSFATQAPSAATAAMKVTTRALICSLLVQWLEQILLLSKKLSSLCSIVKHHLRKDRLEMSGTPCLSRRQAILTQLTNFLPWLIMRKKITYRIIIRKARWFSLLKRITLMLIVQVT